MKATITLLSIALTLLFTDTQAQIPTNTGSKVAQADAQKALDFHNKARKDVGVSPLEWSTELAVYAQAWADKLASSGCEFKHRPNSGKWAQIYGENIFFASDESYTVLDASKGWYNEIEKYKYGKITMSNLPKTGHYTQMVWRDNTQVGIGIATCKKGQIIIVANYGPGGNVIDEKPY